MNLLRFSTFLVLQLCSLSSFSQSAKVDSLRNKIDDLTGIARVDALNTLSYELFSYDFVVAQQVAKEARTMSEQLNYTKGLAESMIYDAVAELNIGNDSISIPELKKSILICETANLKQLQGFGLTYLGLSYKNINKLDSALFFFNKAYDILKDSPRSYYLSFLHLNIANVYALKNEPTLQLENLKKCWQIREHLKDKKYLVYAGEKLCVYYRERGLYEEALSYLDKVQTAIGKDTVANQEISLISKQRALTFVSMGRVAAAIKLLDKAKEFYERNKSSLDITALYLDIGIALSEIGSYESSFKNLFTAGAIAEANHYQYELAQLYFNIGWNYYAIGQYDLANDFAQKTLAASIKFKYKAEEAFAYNLLGKLSAEDQNFSKALDYFNKALALREEREDYIGTASTLLNIGIVHETMGDFHTAEAFALKSLVMEEKMMHLIGMAQCYQQLGQIYTKLHQFGKASEFLARGEVISKTNKVFFVLVDVYKNRRDLLTLQKNYRDAVAYSVHYEILKDSLFNKNLSDRILTLQYDFQIEKKEKEIKILTQQQALQATENRQQRFVITVTFITLLLGGIFSYMLFKNYRKSKLLNREITKQKEEIQQQAGELMENNQIISSQNEKLKSSYEEIAAQNEELVQSQEEISAQRDVVALQNNKLEEAKVIIENQNQEIVMRNETLEKEIAERTKELVEYNQQLEQFAFISAHNLRAPVARILGLGNVLKLPTIDRQEETTIIEKLISTTSELDRVVRDLNTILEVKKNNNSFVTKISLEEEFELIKISLGKELEATQTQLQLDFSECNMVHSVRSYVDSILSNLISNAVKYRYPGRIPVIKLKTEKRGDYVCLIVTDNGLGIDLNLHREKLFTLYSRFHGHVEGKGLGLYLVKSQVSALSGKIEVESAVNKGTTFYVYLRDIPE